MCEKKGKICENYFVTVYTTRLKFAHTFLFKYNKQHKWKYGKYAVIPSGIHLICIKRVSMYAGHLLAAIPSLSSFKINETKIIQIISANSFVKK